MLPSSTSAIVWCLLVHRGFSTLSVPFLFKASLHNPVDRGIQNYDHLPFLVVLTVPSLPHVPTSCKLVTVSIIMFLLAWFVWLTCSMSGSPDVGYTTVAHYTLSGELYTFPACPLDRTCVAALPTLKRLQTWVRPNSTVWGLHSVTTYITTRCSTHIPCHNMRPTGWDPLRSLPDAPFLSS